MYICLYVCILLINIKFMLQALKRRRNFIFIHNVPILCTSCNVKMSKTAPFFFKQKSRNKPCSIFFYGCPLSRRPLYCYCIIPFARYESGTRKGFIRPMTLYKYLNKRYRILKGQLKMDNNMIKG